MIYAPTQFMADHEVDTLNFHDQLESGYIISTRPIDRRTLGCTDCIESISRAFTWIITEQFPNAYLGIAYHLGCVSREEEPFYSCQLLLSNSLDPSVRIIVYSAPWYPGEQLHVAKQLLMGLKQSLYAAYPDRVYRACS